MNAMSKSRKYTSTTLADGSLDYIDFLYRIGGLLARPA